MANRIFGLVLAGGQSRRMGHDKALLQRNGDTQLKHVVGLLEQVTERTFVSARNEQRDDPERQQFELIVDRYDDIGPIAGVLSAMDEHPDVDWLVVACDLPNIDRTTLAYLLEHRSAEQPFSAYRSTYDSLPEPLCAVYTAASHVIIRQFVDDGLICPRKMLIRSDTALFAQPNPAALDNINTPEDLAASVLEAVS
jgi:molybdopterin-guanine dinucleotide biosynthesis protein A